MNRTRTKHGRTATPSRGFTLVELVIAMSLTSIVSLALMSALLMSMRAIPASDDAGLLAARIDSASEFILADAMLASAVEAASTAKLTLTVPDQTGDAAADSVVYTIESGTLTRAVNEGAPRTLVEGFAAGQFAVSATDGRVSSITAVIKTDRGHMHRMSVECLARPEAR